MSEWKEGTLSDIAEIIMGQSPKGDTCNEDGNGLPLLNGPTEFGADHPFPTQFTTDPKKIAKKGDVLFCVRGSTTGRMNWANQEYAIGRGIASIRSKSNMYNSFVYHLLNYRLPYLLGIATGSTFPNVTKDHINELPINIPDSLNLEYINNVLFKLDNKITLLRQQNKDLEELAQTLFKNWFVEFEFPNDSGKPYKSSGGKMIASELGEIPNGWNLSNLGELAENKAKTYKFNGNDVVFINTGDVLEGNFLHKNYSNPTGLPGQAKKAIELNDILYSEIRPRNKRFAFVDFESSEYVVSTKFMVIKTKGEIYPHILYLILKQQASVDKIDFIAESRSGTFPQVTFDSISDFELLKAPMSIQKKIMDVLLPIMQKQKNNEQEIQSLTHLRDTLLPKLMSGELKVKA